jgi:adenylate cyclase
MAKSERRLVPIVSIDVVGFSGLVLHDERQTMRLLRRAYEHFVHGTIGNAGGKVFKTMGDGLLAEFGSIIAAVDWVAGIQKELNVRRIRVPGGELLQVRAGIVLADVLVHGDDLFGNGVNLAVRVQGLSPPGGMAITKWMHEYLAGRSDLEFTDIGPTVLKNIPKTVRIFVWHPESVVRPAESTGLPTARISTRPSVAVLPFDNLSGEADQRYFADAVVEEITATLARIKDFFVVARNSAFSYKGRSVDVRQVGRELGVRYVVEGSVRRVGAKVRITAQLVETDTGSHIWSDRVDGDVAELFDLQDKMAALVASALQPSIRQVEIERARSKRPDTLAAYDLVMRAMPHLWAHSAAENSEAIGLLTRALELEPRYGLASALAAWAHGQQVAYNWTDDAADERAIARGLIDRAAQFVGSDPTALTALASAIMQLGGDVAQALMFTDKALVIDPNHAWGWMRRGFGQVYLGNPDEALASFERSARLSPLDPFSFNVYLGMGLAHFAAGQPQTAIQLANRALAERPGLSWPYRDLTVYHAHTGDSARAREALERFLALRPGISLASIEDSLRFMNADLLGRYLHGLRLAGLE